MLTLFIFLAALLSSLSSAKLALGLDHAAQGEFFETRIRPVLSEKCLSCHTDLKSGGLRADSREGLLEGGLSGPAIIPGNAEDSLLIRTVSHTHERLRMPLGQPKLKDQEVADLKAWVKMGAPWPARARDLGRLPGVTSKGRPFAITPEHRQFWSFRPCQKPPIPKVSRKDWTKSSIDNFILARLETSGLKPVRPAGKRVLIRRAYFDLLGLPPKPEEIEAFLEDESSNAFSKVIDKLLASSHYGERWGRFWLDVARYGEDDPASISPSQELSYQNAWRYRDWTITAFNEDMPYDLFVKAQIAGDLLGGKNDGQNKEQFVAGTGFLGLGPWYYVGDPPQVRADERNDRIDVVTRGFLGLTLACARCHDHKYEPLSMRDYYALAGVFASSQYREYPLRPVVAADFESHKKKTKDLEVAIKRLTDTQTNQLSEILAWHTSRYLMAAWNLINGSSTSSELARAQSLDQQTLEKWARYLTDPVEKDYPFLKPWKDLLAHGGTLDQVKKVADDFQTTVLSLLAERRQLDEENKILAAQKTPKQDLREKIPLPNGIVAFEERSPTVSRPPGRAMEIGRFNLWRDLFTEGDLVDSTKRTDGVLVYRTAEILLSLDGGRSEERLDRFLGEEFRSHLNSMRAELAALKQSMPSYIQGIAESPKARNLRVHLRGNPDNLGEEVPRRFIAVLSQGEPVPFTTGSGRLELAEMIAHHPLTARVIVNRVWQYHFGSGIVRTASNFGTLGDHPSHPELLEHLTSRFIESGYSLKRLHREIMLSATYQLSSDYSEENYAKDSDNRLLWRANRRRLDVEALRDSLLYVSGNLDMTVGGPSAELTDDFKRRTVYGKVSRFRLNSLLALFDFPNPSLTSEQRNVTNVPTQRLFFLNSDLVWHQAGFLAERLGAGSDVGNEAKIRKAYRLLFGREATEAEVRLGIEFLRDEHSESGENRADVDVELISDITQTHIQRQAARISAWQQYAQVLLSSNDFLFVK